jgi:CRP-like cAMP-binding protein
MASAPREVWGDLATTAFVESSHLFKALDAEVRRDLMHLARLASFAPGEAISLEGDDGFYLLREGTAAVLVASREGPVEIALLERGAFFGEARVLGSGRAAALVARSQASAVCFPAPVIAAIAERFPKVRKLLEVVQTARERDAAGKLAS